MGVDPVLIRQRHLLGSLSEAFELAKRGDIGGSQVVKDQIAASLIGLQRPIQDHIRAQLARLEAYLSSLSTPEPGARDPVFARLGLTDSRIRELRAPVWSPRNRKVLSTVADKARPFWWRCQESDAHPEWLASVWEYERGRPCPACLLEAGFGSDDWRPPQIEEAIGSIAYGAHDVFRSTAGRRAVGGW